MGYIHVSQCMRGGAMRLHKTRQMTTKTAGHASVQNRVALVLALTRAAVVTKSAARCFWCICSDV